MPTGHSTQPMHARAALPALELTQTPIELELMRRKGGLVECVTRCIPEHHCSVSPPAACYTLSQTTDDLE